MKGIIIIFMLIGSYIGSYIPVFWGDNIFSLYSVLLGAIGGIIGIWIGYKIATLMSLN
jgi:hypothetical protein